MRQRPGSAGPTIQPAWALENLVEGRVVNRIQVLDDVKYWARTALDRMLEIGA